MFGEGVGYTGYTHPCDTELGGNSSVCEEHAEKRNIGIALLEPSLDIDLDRTVDIEGISNFISRKSNIIFIEAKTFFRYSHRFLEVHSIQMFSIP